MRARRKQRPAPYVVLSRARESQQTFFCRIAEQTVLVNRVGPRSVLPEPLIYPPDDEGGEEDSDSSSSAGSDSDASDHESDPAGSSDGGDGPAPPRAGSVASGPPEDSSATRLLDFGDDEVGGL